MTYNNELFLVVSEIWNELIEKEVLPETIEAAVLPLKEVLFLAVLPETIEAASYCDMEFIIAKRPSLNFR